MASIEFDYTAKRLGSKQPPHNRKVMICGKCGRRGTDDGILKRKDGTFPTQMVTHISHLEFIAGIAFVHVDEHCMYSLTPHTVESEVRS